MPHAGGAQRAQEDLGVILEGPRLPNTAYTIESEQRRSSQVVVELGNSCGISADLDDGKHAFNVIGVAVGKRQLLNRAGWGDPGFKPKGWGGFCH